MNRKLSYWMDVEMMRTKGHIKYDLGDGASLVVQMRKPNKLFIIESWRWDAPSFRRTHIHKRYAKTRREAERIYQEVLEEF